MPKELYERPLTNKSHEQLFNEHMQGIKLSKDEYIMLSLGGKSEKGFLFDSIYVRFKDVSEREFYFIDTAELAGIKEISFVPDCYELKDEISGKIVIMERPDYSTHKYAAFCTLQSTNIEDFVRAVIIITRDENVEEVIFDSFNTYDD